MIDLLNSLYKTIVLGALLQLSLATQAQSDNWYRVEVMVFSYPAGGAAEQWPPTPELAYPQEKRFLILPGEQTLAANAPAAVSPVPGATTARTAGSETSVPTDAPRTPFATLPVQQRELSSSVASMQRSGRYRILFHEAWLQPVTSQAGALPIVLDSSGDGGKWPELQGSILVYMSNDIYLETNLWLNTQGEYLNSAWHMPPPPLGPTSIARDTPEQTMRAATAAPPDTAAGPQDATASSVPPGPAYPFKHAVLLQQTQRMHIGAVNYVDHPMLGLVAKITSMSEAGSQTTEEAEKIIPEPPTPISGPST